VGISPETLWELISCNFIFSWSNEDIERLCWLYSSCAGVNDPISLIVDTYKERGNGGGKSRENILNQLYMQGIIGQGNFIHYVPNNYGDGGRVGIEDPVRSDPGTTPNENPFISSSSPPSTSPDVDLFSMDVSIPGLIKDFITIGGHGTANNLDWIQEQVLAACYVKWVMEENGVCNGVRPLLQPVAHHFAREYNFCQFLNKWELT